jgi:hypothetical protein
MAKRGVSSWEFLFSHGIHGIWELVRLNASKKYFNKNEEQSFRGIQVSCGCCRWVLGSLRYK